MRNPFLLFDLPSTRAKFYIVFVIVSGLVLFCYSLFTSLTGPDRRWIYLAAATIVGSWFPIKIPLLEREKQSLTITFSDVFVLTAMALFGPHVAAILAAIEGLVTGLRVRVRRLYKHLFNVATLVLVAFFVGQLFKHMEAGPLQPEHDLPKLLMMFAVCGLVYFVLNSSVISLAMAFVTDQSVGKLWFRNFLWTSPANFVNSLSAGVLFVHFPPPDLYFAFLIIALPAIIFYVHKVNLNRIKQVSQSLVLPSHGKRV